jgi:hypothetical protein
VTRAFFHFNIVLTIVVFVDDGGGGCAAAAVAAGLLIAVESTLVDGGFVIAETNKNYL